MNSIQREQGSRKNYAKMELNSAPTRLPPEVKDFIQQTDLFYQASVASSGWPYVQHRGGPKGFLKVLSDYQLGYADFKGNRQSLSVGNIQSNSNVSLIIMDYPRKSRLKIWARAEIVTKSEAPELIQ